MKRLVGFLSVAMLVAVVAVPLAAQTIRLTASVPFEFMVAGRILPAGDYTVGSVGSTGSGAIEVSNGNSAVISLTNNSSVSSKSSSGQALLIFHRYGDQYFLARVVDGNRGAGLEILPSHTEKELSKMASIEKFETIAVLARR
jgi:hypothetical protein